MHTRGYIISTIAFMKTSLWLPRAKNPDWKVHPWWLLTEVMDEKDQTKETNRFILLRGPQNHRDLINIQINQIGCTLDTI